MPARGLGSGECVSDPQDHLGLADAAELHIETGGLHEALCALQRPDAREDGDVERLAAI